MPDVATVEQQPQSPPAEPAKDHGYPDGALTKEREGYSHTQPEPMDAKKEIRRMAREHEQREQAEKEALGDTDKRIEQFSKQNEETLREAVRTRSEVDQAIKAAPDGEKLWDAIKDHRELVETFEKATPEQIEKLLAATREELAKTDKSAAGEERQRPEPKDDFERVLARAAEQGEEAFSRTSETLDRFMYPQTAQLAAANQVLAAVLAHEVPPGEWAGVVHALMSDPKKAMALETAQNAEAIVKAVQETARTMRLESAKQFYTRFQGEGNGNSNSKVRSITRVPPPLEEVRGKNTKAPDVLEEALRAGDVGAYRRELNRQRRAAARG